MQKVETLNIQGEKIEIVPDLFLARGNDVTNIPALIYEWGVYLAKATEQRIQIEGEYRRWRATYSEAIVERKPKLPEWRVRQQTDATEEFGVFQLGRAQAERNVLTVAAVVEALHARADIAAR